MSEPEADPQYQPVDPEQLVGKDELDEDDEIVLPGDDLDDPESG